MKTETKLGMTERAQNAKIQEFLELYRKGAEMLLMAGEILVELVDDDPHVYDCIIRQCPAADRTVLSRLELIGRRILHPDLLLPGNRQLDRLSKLPLSMQARYLEEPVEVIVETEQGTEVLRIKVGDMTPDQYKQAFDKTGPRSLGGQKAMLAEITTRAMAEKRAGVRHDRYQIKGRTVRFLSDEPFCVADLTGIINQLTKSK